MLNKHSLFVQLQKAIFRRKNEEEGQREGGGLDSDLGQVCFPWYGLVALPVKRGIKADEH